MERLSLSSYVMGVGSLNTREAPHYAMTPIAESRGARFAPPNSTDWVAASEIVPRIRERLYRVAVEVYRRRFLPVRGSKSQSRRAGHSQGSSAPLHVTSILNGALLAKKGGKNQVSYCNPGW
jgi:hypothetical protein